jgi:hypothetical protein
LENLLVDSGIFYNFQFSVWWSEGGRYVKIRSVETVQEHKEKEVRFPLRALPWLRKQMTIMLEKHDGTQRIDEMPTIPAWVWAKKIQFN